ELEPIEHRLGQAKRYGLRRRPQVREGHTLGFAPVDEVCRVVLRPEVPLAVLALEFGQWLFHDDLKILRSLRLMSRAEITRIRRPRIANTTNISLPLSLWPRA